MKNYLEKYEKELKKNGYKIVQSSKTHPWIKAVKHAKVTPHET